jgi:hypothetical protein
MPPRLDALRAIDARCAPPSAIFSLMMVPSPSTSAQMADLTADVALIAYTSAGTGLARPYLASAV